jgi:hypothetical protein
MHTVAMDLVDRVLPGAPYRHWVLALPIELRFVLARDDGLLASLRAIFVRALRSWLQARAKVLGVPKPPTGAVVFTQRRRRPAGTGLRDVAHCNLTSALAQPLAAATVEDLRSLANGGGHGHRATP